MRPSGILLIKNVISLFSVNTSAKKELVDITDKVKAIIKKSKVKEGIALIFAKHTTCAVIISEIEDYLEKDFIQFLETEGPRGPFKHSHGDLNAHDPVHASQSHTPAHLMSATIGQSKAIPVSNKELLLGTWQRVCLLELDGPRTREVVVQLLS